MMKKLIFLSVAFMAINSFSYMELSFGIGNRSIDYKELTTAEGYEPHGGNIFLSFQGHTDQNALYGVSYSVFEHDLLDDGDLVDFEIPNSNWNFGLDLSISEYGETLNIGPTVKF